MKIVLYNMLCSLKFIHSANIMHRDIKPDNFLLSSEGYVKITDFGLSRTMQMLDMSASVSSALTQNMNLIDPNSFNIDEATCSDN